MKNQALFSGKAPLSSSAYILQYKTTQENQLVRLTSMAEYFDSILILETREELIKCSPSKILDYTFQQKGIHNVAIKFKMGRTSLAKCFSECSDLTSIPQELFNDCRDVKNLSFCFKDCTSLTSIRF